MGYGANAKLYYRFDSSLLGNETTGAGLEVSGSPAVLTDGWRGSGLELSPDTTLYTTASLGVTTAMTLGFWLKPTHEGMVVNPSTPALEGLRKALFSKASFSRNGTTGDVTVSGGSFVVYEETEGDEQNRLYVNVYGATDATAYSTAYTAGEWHHFWVVYDGSVPSISIWVDGASATGGTTGTVPASLTSVSDNFEINQNVPGSGYAVSRNTAVLDELVLLNTAETGTDTIGRVIDLGVEYAFDDDLTDVEEVCLGALFDDPTTLKVNAVMSDGADLYVGRSDGKLLKASRGLWKSRRHFVGEGEKTILENAFGTDGSKLSVSDGVVTVTKAVIRA
jgi:hypothetical protein